MRFLDLFALCVSTRLVNACADNDSHHHNHPRRAYHSAQLAPPTRPLEWGDVNVIHTTDTHGWLLGHQKTSFPEPNYSGDFGEFSSFVSHMKEIAEEKDVDLLLVDSGDLHDGTGLSDGFPPGGVDGHDSNKFIAMLPYDIMAIGNHELYIYANTLDMYQNFAPGLKGRYLSSNVNITIFDQNNKSVSVPVGSRYRKFKTKKGRRVTSFGVIFNFTGNDVNTTVQPVQAMVQETWFKEAVFEEPDFFLLVGHMPVRQDNWPIVHNAIRAVHPTTPILTFGGHSHIRDCILYDGRSVALEAGRYMETVGWLSAKLDEGDSRENLSFTRRYLDPNRVAYEYHTRKSNESFDTKRGERITRGLHQLAVDYDLGYLYGTAPMDYTLTQSPYPSNGSLLSLLVSQALLYVLNINNSRSSIPNLVIVNSGAMRFDLYSGPFTKNDQLTSAPFTSKFLYVSNVSYGLAKEIAPWLNNPARLARRDSGLGDREAELYGMGYVGKQFSAWLEEMNKQGQEETEKNVTKTLGYVTHDDCPGAGDDIRHQPLPYFPAPTYIVSDPPVNITDTTAIDLVFLNFFQKEVITCLNKLQSLRKFTNADVSLYSPLLIDQVLGVYAQGKWD